MEMIRMKDSASKDVYVGKYCDGNVLEAILDSQAVKMYDWSKIKPRYSFRDRIPVYADGNDEVREILKEIELIFEENKDRTQILWQDFTKVGSSNFSLILSGKFDSVVEIGYRHGNISFTGYSEGLEDLQSFFTEFSKRMEKFRESEDERDVDIAISFYTKNGPEYTTTRIKCEKWEDISDNYDPANSQKITPYMNGRFSTDNGSLLIWWGLPGTGKTYAIRSLMQGLRKKYHPVYVTDPEVFLMKTEYYYNMIHSFDEPCLFIMEDAANSLLKENRSSHGTQIAKLLNMTDGILAQGRKDLFLITFNEDLKELDEAVIRVGRCLDRTQFDKLSVSNANAWLKSKEIEDVTVEEDQTLAELYGVFRDHFPDETIPDGQMGFAVPLTSSSARRRRRSRF
jgi:hypothetical protein